MSFSYTPSTNIGLIRLEIDDRDATSVIFQDEELQAWLDSEGDWRRAAAKALDNLAKQSASLLSIKSGDDSVNGGTTAKEYREHAAALRTQADTIDNQSGGGFAIAEWATDPFSARDILGNAMLRGAL